MLRIVLYATIALVIVVGSVAIFGSRARLQTIDIPLGHSQPEYVSLGVSRSTSPAVASAIAQNGHRAASIAIVQIARSANVTLLVSDVDRAEQRIEILASERKGDLLSANEQFASAGDASGASMQARVPADSFFDFLSALNGLGTVRDRSITADDKTAEIVDGTARLRNLRSTEADIRAIMNRSGSVSDVLEAENQLSTVREQIETLQAELASAKGQVSFSTVSITLIALAPPRNTTPAAAYQLTDTFHMAVQAFAQFLTALAAMLIWLVVFSPVLGVALVAVWLARRYFAPAAL